MSRVLYLKSEALCAIPAFKIQGDDITFTALSAKHSVFISFDAAFTALTVIMIEL